MALSFPLALSGFANKLKIINAPFMLKRFVVTSGMGTGDVNTYEVTQPKWYSDITLAAAEVMDLEEIQAIIEAIGPHERFNIFNPKHPYPRLDPTGSILGSSAVRIYSVGDAQSIRLAGLPFQYQLSVGDMFSFTKDGIPSLHRIVEPVVAAVTGITNMFEFRPSLPAGVSVNTAITLKKPFCRMMIVQDSFTPGDTQGIVTGAGMSFSAMEAP